MSSPPRSPERHVQRRSMEDIYGSDLQQRGLCGSKWCSKGPQAGTKRKSNVRDGDGPHSSTPSGSHVSDSPFALVAENLGSSPGNSASSLPVRSARRVVTPIRDPVKQQVITRGQQQQQRQPSLEQEGSLHGLDVSPAVSQSPALERSLSGDSFGTAVGGSGESSKRQASGSSPSRPSKRLSTADSPVVPPSRWLEPEKQQQRKIIQKSSAADSPSTLSKTLFTGTKAPVVPPSRWSKEEEDRSSFPGKTSSPSTFSKSTKELSPDDSRAVQLSRSSKQLIPPHRSSKEDNPPPLAKQLSTAHSPVVPPSRWGKEEEEEVRRPSLSKQLSTADYQTVQPSESSKKLLSDAPVVPPSPWSSDPAVDRSTSSSKRLALSDLSSLPPMRSSKKSSGADSPVVPPSKWGKDEDRSATTSSLTKRGNCIGKNCAGTSFLVDKLQKSPTTSSDARKKQKNKASQQQQPAAGVSGGTQYEHSSSEDSGATLSPGGAAETPRLSRAQNRDPSHGSSSEANTPRTYTRPSSDLSQAGSLLPPMQSGSTYSLSAWDEPAEKASGNKNKVFSFGKPSLVRRGACLGKACVSKESQFRNQQAQQRQQQDATAATTTTTPSLQRSPSGNKSPTQRASSEIQRVRIITPQSLAGLQPNIPAPESPSRRRSSSESPSMTRANSLSIDRTLGSPIAAAGTPHDGRSSPSLASSRATTPGRSRPVSAGSQPASADATHGSSSAAGSGKQLSASTPDGSAEQQQPPRGSQGLPLPEHIPIRTLSASTQAQSPRISAWHDPGQKPQLLGTTSGIGAITRGGSIGPSVSQRVSNVGDNHGEPSSSRPQSASSVQPAPPFRLLGSDGGRSRSMTRTQSAESGGSGSGAGARFPSISRTLSQDSGEMERRRQQPTPPGHTYTDSTGIEQIYERPATTGPRDTTTTTTSDVAGLRKRDTELVKRDSLLLTPRGGGISKGYLSNNKESASPPPSEATILRTSALGSSSPANKAAAGSSSDARNIQLIQADATAATTRAQTYPKLMRRGGCTSKPCTTDDDRAPLSPPETQRSNSIPPPGRIRGASSSSSSVPPPQEGETKRAHVRPGRSFDLTPPSGCMGAGCLSADVPLSLPPPRLRGPATSYSASRLTGSYSINSRQQALSNAESRSATESRSAAAGSGITRRKSRLGPRGLCMSKACQDDNHNKKQKNKPSLGSPSLSGQATAPRRVSFHSSSFTAARDGAAVRPSSPNTVPEIQPDLTPEEAAAAAKKSEKILTRQPTPRPGALSRTSSQSKSPGSPGPSIPDLAHNVPLHQTSLATRFREARNAEQEQHPQQQQQQQQQKEQRGQDIHSSSSSLHQQQEEEAGPSSSFLPRRPSSESQQRPPSPASSSKWEFGKRDLLLSSTTS